MRELRLRPFVAAVGFCLAGVVSVGQAQSLKGSPQSVGLQHSMAVRQDYSFLENAADVRRFVRLGLLVPLNGGAHYELARVSFPYARPAIRSFVERLSAQYDAACGEPLVVTSLTRPMSRQPANASDESVHPTGMAVDLRVSDSRACRSWLERTLLALERSDVVEATREHYPAHYHVAVFPREYTQYVARMDRAAGTRVAVAASEDESGSGGPSATDDGDTAPYRVHRGDSLWSIARDHDTSVTALMEMNGLEKPRINAGQVLRVPSSGR